MQSNFNQPLRPRIGNTLVVGIVARISGGPNQKELSLDDQVDHAKQVVADLWDGPVDFRIIATTGKGERLDRPELAKIESMLVSGELDLLVAEDIGRMVRGAEAVSLCGVAVDHGTRVIAPNDCIDTAEESWEGDALSACRDHVGHNAHTSKRLKQKLKNRFVKFGGATSLPICGYIKPPGAKTFDDWSIDPAALTKIQEGADRLKASLNCSAVADWFNKEGIPTGKYCKRKVWDGRMVRRFFANPILKGMPCRGTKHTIKHHQTGRRIAVANPKGPVYRECPDLAVLSPADFDELNALLDQANSRYKRKTVSGVDPRWQVPRKRTRFPGQHIRCWYCGRQCVWGGNGMTNNLMCNSAREWKCWNGFGFNGALAVKRLVNTICAELYTLDGLDNQFRELVQEARNEGGLTDRSKKLLAQEQARHQKEEHFLAAIAAYGPKPMFQQQLMELEQVEREQAKERRELVRLKDHAFTLPASTAELRDLIEAKFHELALDSQELGDLLRQIVPDFYVYLVELCDGGHPLPRAKARFSPMHILPDARFVPGLTEKLSLEFTLDLFEKPPQRERIRLEATRFAAQGMNQREIARNLSEPATQAAVHNALALDRQMRERGLDSPYVLLERPPQDYAKLRRHLNPRYDFQMLEGYERPSL